MIDLKTLVQDIEIMIVRIETQKDIIDFMETEQAYCGEFTNDEINNEKFLMKTFMEKLKVLEQQEEQIENCLKRCAPAKSLIIPIF